VYAALHARRSTVSIPNDIMMHFVKDFCRVRAFKKVFARFGAHTAQAQHLPSPVIMPKDQKQDVSTRGRPRSRTPAAQVLHISSQSSAALQRNADQLSASEPQQYFIHSYDILVEIKSCLTIN
jgi:hypothetical protein